MLYDKRLMPALDECGNFQGYFITCKCLTFLRVSYSSQFICGQSGVGVLQGVAAKTAKPVTTLRASAATAARESLLI